MPIRFFQEGINFQLKQKNLLRKWLMDSSKAEGYSIQSLTFVYINDENLLALNRQYLSHDEYTDIITFDLSEKSVRKKKEIEGEIYISHERVKENAKTFGKSFQDELHRVMIHGVLHLCGYSDKNSASKKKMTAKEDYYLKKLRRIIPEK